MDSTDFSSIEDINVADASIDLDRIDGAIEDASDDVETIQSVAITLDKEVVTPEKELQVVRVALEGLIKNHKLIGPKQQQKVFANATTLGLAQESIAQAMVNIWKTIVEYISRAYNWIKDKVKSMFRRTTVIDQVIKKTKTDAQQAVVVEKKIQDEPLYKDIQAATEKNTPSPEQEITAQQVQENTLKSMEVIGGGSEDFSVVAKPISFSDYKYLRYLDKPVGGVELGSKLHELFHEFDAIRREHLNASKFEKNYNLVSKAFEATLKGSAGKKDITAIGGDLDLYTLRGKVSYKKGEYFKGIQLYKQFSEYFLGDHCLVVNAPKNPSPTDKMACLTRIDYSFSKSEVEIATDRVIPKMDPSQALDLLNFLDSRSVVKQDYAMFSKFEDKFAEMEKQVQSAIHSGQEDGQNLSNNVASRLHGLLNYLRNGFIMFGLLMTSYEESVTLEVVKYCKRCITDFTHVAKIVEQSSAKA